MKNVVRSSWIVLLLLAAAAPWGPGRATAAPGGESVIPAPLGFTKYFAYLATEEFDLLDPTYEPPFGMVVHPGFPGFLIGTGFQSEVMGRSPAEIVAFRNEAVLFLWQRFGLHPADYSTEPDPFKPPNNRLLIAPFMVDPRTGASVHHISGTSVGGEGIPLLDGGWAVQVADPAGYTLSDGTHVPQGTLFPYGNYRIEVPRRDLHGPDENNPPSIRYRAIDPILPAVTGLGLPIIRVDCELQSPEFGRGIARGSYKYSIGANGLWRTNLREMLTFGENQFLP